MSHPEARGMIPIAEPVRVAHDTVEGDGGRVAVWPVASECPEVHHGPYDELDAAVRPYRDVLARAAEFASDADRLSRNLVYALTQSA